MSEDSWMICAQPRLRAGTRDRWQPVAPFYYDVLANRDLAVKAPSFEVNGAYGDGSNIQIRLVSHDLFRSRPQLQR